MSDNKEQEKSEIAPKSANGGSGEHSSEKSVIAKQEEKILEFWNKEEIFKKSLDKSSPEGEFIFYEGPPTANGKPGIHHLEARAFKDVIPRYKTMQGFHVRRKGGWDTHGLPVELQVEKQLGLKSKKEIEEYGIAEFNLKCKESVWEYLDIWNKFTYRMGYWVDQENPYITYKNDYIESIWNIVSKINEKKLLYKDYKVVPWCPRCGTALSSHELAQGYKDITDISVTIEFRVVGKENTSILAWTTTPWTLPGNVGLAVGPEIDYVEIEKKDEGVGKLVRYILAKERLSAVFPNDEYKIIKEMKGSDLVGLQYEPLYDYIKTLATGEAKEKLPNAWKVYPADFVTTVDGTGVVHTAVMYGQEDFELGVKVGLRKFHIVALDGTFIPGTGFLSGMHVRDESTAVEVMKDLANRGLLFKKEKYKHSYPHCWRCDTALIYYARDSWYVRMSELRDKLQKENEKINWEPEHLKEGRFGEWLREVKDWAISRERYWGTPMPIWLTEDGEMVVIGSVEELKERIGQKNKYFVMRHGQADHNVKNLVSSKKDDQIHLTEKGKKEVEEQAKKLKKEKITKIFSSPFVRTKETTAIVLKELGLSEDDVIYDERLSEINLGEFTGGDLDLYRKFAPTCAERYDKRPNGGENLADVKRRAGEFLYELNSKYKDENILIISHEYCVWMMFAVTNGFDKEGTVNLRGSAEDFIEEGVATELSFVSLPHNKDYELDLHKPYIDDVVCFSDQGKPMKRAKEVLDVWFDSGSMPFAQDHYPFENKKWVDGVGYPADFISEAIDQTRGWFYTLLAIGVLVGKGTPFKNVICLGHILDNKGVKMSKHIGNIVDPWVMIDKYGVDALRLWMYSVNQPGDSKNFDEKTVDEIVKKIFNPLINIFTLYSTYREGVSVGDPFKSKNPLDKWILARLNNMINEGTDHLEKYKISEPVRLLRDFVQDFSTWYIRRSRDRFKSTDVKEKEEAIRVTKHVLVELSKFIAPFAPFFAEQMYLDVTEGTEKVSVHLENWPKGEKVDGDLLEDMRKVREIVTSALELRQKAGIKVRQPLQNLKFKISNFKLKSELLEIIKDEINVKEIVYDEGIKNEIELDINITKELKEEGLARDIIRAIQDARKKENLVPSDVIKLVVRVPDEIVSIFDSYADMIKSPTGVSSVEFSKEKQTHVVFIDEKEVTITLLK
jgi:isoleucyl-tRNA synthetase